MFHIPEENLPECLKDEKRINVLFAPLRNRSVNSKDWDSKISSWKTIIKVYCETNYIYSFSLSSLNNVFIRNGRPPSCLSEVIEDMIKNGEVQEADIFFRKCSDTWSGWAADILIKRPLSWSFTKVNSMLIAKDSSNITYVHIETVKSKSQMLLDSIPTKSRNKLISLKDVLNISGKEAKLEGIKLLLHYLSNERNVVITKLNGKDELETFLIKFGDGHKVTSISEVDIGIYTLEQNESVIKRNMESLEDDIRDCVKEAKIHLSKNHKQLAKSSLRKKRELEKRLEKKSIALNNVLQLLQQIHDVHSDAHVWDSYKKALSAFNTSFKDTGLSEDSIDDTMIKLGEMLDKHDDIQASLSRPPQDSEAGDSELEEELEELLKGDINNPPPDGGLNTSDLEMQMDKLSINLPDVPTVSPNISQIIETTGH